MKTQLLSTLQTLKSVRSRCKATKNDSFLSKPMDLPGENGSCNGNIDGENEFNNGSSYSEGEALEAKQSGNVNSTPSQWPLRHNNHNESLERQNSYSCNGFREAKKPRCTYTGRISRIPSRYLDTDSDSGDGSVKKDGQSRLKVKRTRRRRKLPSSTSKFLLNGFKKHGEALLESVAGFNADGITDNVGEIEQECVANVECPDVFEDTSPISNDNISHHETPDKSAFDLNTSFNNKLTSSRISRMDCVNDVLESTIVDDFCSKSKQTAKDSLTCSSCCVDILNKNNSRRRFESLMESNEELTAVTCHENDQNYKQTLENCSTAFVNKPCKRKDSNEVSKSDSSTRQTIVSPKLHSKHCEVSCAIHNDSTGSLIERKNCKNCKECAVKSSCIVANISSENIHSTDFNSPCETTVDIGDIDSKLSRKNPLVKATKKPSNKLLSKHKSKELEPYIFETSKAKELDCMKDLKMRKAIAKKLKQKQLRRNENSSENDVLKSRKNGVICKVKQKSVGKVNSRKMDKQGKKLKKKKVAKIKETGVTKQSQQLEELDRVLGMRRSPSGVYEFLVEWHNGTSCWVSSDEIVTDKHNYYLREYLVETEHDVSVVNRVPFQAYCCDSLSLKECKPVVKSKKALGRMLGVDIVQKRARKPAIVPVKDDVVVEYKENYCYITLNRETCKFRKTCLKIMTDLITAMEDAATSACEVVVVQGLGSDVLCGLKLDDMSKPEVDEKENVMLSKARYLVQTLTNYPKLLIALITKSAEGIGAVFLSLFDMICDEETWNRQEVLNPCAEESKNRKLYTLPRLTGHSLLSAEILMGKQSLAAKPHCPASGDETRITDSSSVASTLIEIETTLRLLQKETSLLQMSGEFTKLSSANQPSFALFSDIKSQSFSANEYNEGDNGQSLRENSDNDHLLTVENPIDHEVGESNTVNVLSKECSHPVKQQCDVEYNSSEKESNDRVTTDNFEIERISGDESATEPANSGQGIMDNATNNQSITSHVNTYQSMTDGPDQSITQPNAMDRIIGNRTSTDHATYIVTDHSNYSSIDQKDHSSIDQVSDTSIPKNSSTSTIDHSQHTNASQIISTDQCNHTSIDQSNNASVDQPNHTITNECSIGDTDNDHTTKEHTVTDQSTMDHASTYHSAMNQDDDREMLNHTNVDQSLTAYSTTTDSDSIADSILDNGVTDRTVNYNICYDEVADTSTAETTSNRMEVCDDQTTEESDAVETQLNNVSRINVEKSLDHAVSDRFFTARTTIDHIETNLIQWSSNGSSCDTPKENSNITDNLVNEICTDGLIRDTIDENASDRLETDHSCPEIMDNTTRCSTIECGTFNQCIGDESNTDKTNATSDPYIVNSNINGRLCSAVQACKDEISEQDSCQDPGDRDLMTGSSSPNRTENRTYMTNTSFVPNLTSGLESNENCAESSNYNSTKLNHSTSNRDTCIFSEAVDNFTMLDSYSPNKNKQIRTNDIDIDITNYPSTEDNCVTNASETIPHAMTDSIRDNTAEHASMNDNENFPSTSTAATAVDRYLKTLEAQIEEEKRQAQQYIEEISRLWDNPFLSTNL